MLAGGKSGEMQRDQEVCQLPVALPALARARLQSRAGSSGEENKTTTIANGGRLFLTL